jgi:hypothetical protein
LVTSSRTAPELQQVFRDRHEYIPDRRPALRVLSVRVPANVLNLLRYEVCSKNVTPPAEVA